MLLNFCEFYNLMLSRKNSLIFVLEINNGHDLLGVAFSTHNSTALCYHGSPGR